MKLLLLILFIVSLLVTIGSVLLAIWVSNTIDRILSETNGYPPHGTPEYDAVNERLRIPHMIEKYLDNAFVIGGICYLLTTLTLSIIAIGIMFLK